MSCVASTHLQCRIWRIGLNVAWPNNSWNKMKLTLTLISTHDHWCVPLENYLTKSAFDFLLRIFYVCKLPWLPMDPSLHQDSPEKKYHIFWKLLQKSLIPDLHILIQHLNLHHLSNWLTLGQDLCQVLQKNLISPSQLSADGENSLRQILFRKRKPLSQEHSSALWLLANV